MAATLAAYGVKNSLRKAAGGQAQHKVILSGAGRAPIIGSRVTLNANNQPAVKSVNHVSNSNARKPNS